MKDEDLKQLFKQLDGTPDDTARAKAIAAALAAFDAAQAGDEKNTPGDQGSAAIHRLTPRTHPTGSKTMTTTSNISENRPLQRWLYSGVASAAVLVVGVFITLQLAQHSGFDIPNRAQPKSDTHNEVSQAPSGVDQDQSYLASTASVGMLNSPQSQPPSLPSRDHAQGMSANVAAYSAASPAAASPAPRTRMLEEEVVMASKRLVGGQEMQLATPGAQLTASDTITAPGYQDTGRDDFETVAANPVKRVADEPVSTFSIDVDTSSYSFVRRELDRGVLPQKAAVRLEEMVNYFPYAYPVPEDASVPFSTNVAVIDAPWKSGNKLVRIGIQGYELQGARPHTNLVFLLDVSGSMNSPDKLPLVKQSIGLLLSSLQPEDTVAIAVYAGASGTVLEPTPVREKQKILSALNSLQAGGATAGAAGIQLCEGWGKPYPACHRRRFQCWHHG